MGYRDDIIAGFADGGAGLLWLPDLSLWHDWHRSRGALPAGWQSYSLADCARALGAPAWLAVPPWRLETPGVDVRTVERDGERTVTTETPAGPLVGRWALMPDGDWWQTEYPVKSEADLPAARALIEARSYVPDPAQWTRLDAAVGEAGVVAVELPRRPYSEVLHTLLGWSEGLTLLLGGGRAAILEMLDALDAKVQACVREAAQLPGALAYSPDNLDGQFIPPSVFAEHLAASYRETAETLHAAGKRLVVHAGGPARRLLAPLAEAGVDAVEGVAGPPQGDAPLAEARTAAGPHAVPWRALRHSRHSSRRVL